MYGVNKETVIKEDVIKYRLHKEKKISQIHEINQFVGVEELIILTNDFRNEYYLYVDETVFSHGEFLRYLAEQTSKTLQEIILETYSKFNEDVLRHLFEVSNGYLTNPIGSFKGLETVEKAIHFARKTNTNGEVLLKLFNDAIELTYDFKLNEAVQPLNKSIISKYIYLLKKKMGTLDKKNYLISGNDFEVCYLAKSLLLAGAQTITVIQRTEEESLKQVQNVTAYMTDAESAKVFAVTSKSLHYRISKTDAAILNTSEIDLFDEDTIDNVAVIRQTKKKQYLIDTSENPLTEIDKEQLDIFFIDANSNVSFNDEQINLAIAKFDEEIQSHIEHFMLQFEELQVEKSKEITH